MTPEFKHWPKIPRLSKETCTITEKIDGTNGILFINPELNIVAGSRNRWLTPQADNYGFAGWVEAHKDELKILGPGYHYGEWWGLGIQRNYGLTEKRFSLFYAPKGVVLPGCVDVVPWLYSGKFHEGAIEYCLDALHTQGSRAAPGFMKPEGLVVYLHDAGKRYKVLLENDGLHKCQVPNPAEPIKLEYHGPIAN